MLWWLVKNDLEELALLYRLSTCFLSLTVGDFAGLLPVNMLRISTKEHSLLHLGRGAEDVSLFSSCFPSDSFMT